MPEALGDKQDTISTGKLIIVLKILFGYIFVNIFSADMAIVDEST